MLEVTSIKKKKRVEINAPQATDGNDRKLARDSYLARESDHSLVLKFCTYFEHLSSSLIFVRMASKFLFFSLKFD